MDERLIQCEFFVPIVRNSDKKPHQPSAWIALGNEIRRTFPAGHSGPETFYRGDTLARMGRADEAEAAFLSEIKLFPTDPQAYKNLLLLYATEGKTRQATDLVFSLEKASPAPASYVAICETLKLIGDVNGAHFWAARGLNRYPGDRSLRALLRG